MRYIEEEKFSVSRIKRRGSARQLGYHCTVQLQDARTRALNRHSETGPACFRVEGQRRIALSELITGRDDNQARNPLATSVASARARVHFHSRTATICVSCIRAEKPARGCRKAEKLESIHPHRTASEQHRRDSRFIGADSRIAFFYGRKSVGK